MTDDSPSWDNTFNTLEAFPQYQIIMVWSKIWNLRSQSTLKKIENLKTFFCWFTVLPFNYNEGKMVFLTKMLFLNEI